MRLNDDGYTEDGLSELDPSTGDYLPQAVACYSLATDDARLQPMRDVAEHGAWRSETHLVVVPAQCLGTLVSYPTTPIVWVMWLPDDWFDELTYLTRAVLDVTNLPAIGGRNATTGVSIVGRTRALWGDTNHPPCIRLPGVPASPLVLVFVCQGIAHVVRYTLASRVYPEIAVASMTTHTDSPAG